MNAGDMADLINKIGGSVYRQKFDNWTSEREQLSSMCHAFEIDDYTFFRVCVSKCGLSIVWDGHKISNKGMTMFREQGDGGNDEIKPRQMDFINLKKKIPGGDGLKELLSIETEPDIYPTITKLITEKLKANWNCVNSVTADGKAAHFCDHRGMEVNYHSFA